MKYNFHYLWFLIFYLISPEIFAGVFDVIPTDKSKEYLGIIFGGSVGAISLGGSANPTLSIMFERFNFIIVTAGVVILSYVGIISAINTAREGEAMGKKFSLWVPLRGLFGMLLMLPSPGTGYSLVQMTVIWIVLNGIGAANTVWNTVLDQMARGLKIVGNIEMPISKIELDRAAQGILVSATCMAKLNSLSQLDLIKSYGSIGVHVVFDKYNIDNPNKPTTLRQKARINIGVAPSSSKPPPAGALTICGSIPLETVIYNNNPKSGDAFNVASIEQRLQIKVNAILAMFDALSGTANSIASCPSTQNCVDNLNKGYINASEAAYKAQIVNLAGGVRSPVGGAAYGSASGGRVPPRGAQGAGPAGGGGGGGGGGPSVGDQARAAGRTAGENIAGAGQAATAGINSAGEGARNAAGAAVGGAAGAGESAYGGAAGAAGSAYSGAAGAAGSAYQGATSGSTYTGAAGAAAGAASSAYQGAAGAASSAYSGVTADYGGAASAAGAGIETGANAAANAPAQAGNAIGSGVTQGFDRGVGVGEQVQNLWEQAPAPVAITSDQTNSLKTFGWIHAGSYYYALSQQNLDDYGQDALAVPTITAPHSYSGDFTGANPPTSASQTNWSGQLYDQLTTNTNRQSFNDALKWSEEAGSDASYTSGSLPALGSGHASTGNAFMDQIVSALADGMRDPILNFFQQQITAQSEDPLVAMGRFGWKLMMAGEALIFAAIVSSAGIMLGISAGSCLNPLPWAGDTLFSQIFLVLYGVIILLWGAGATLGIYLPLVPYIVFTITAFGWMIAVVEAVVGAPLIALALIQPSGEELGQIKSGLGIIATIFLKPVLMIFGFILAGSLLRAGLTMLNFGFVKAVNQSVLPTVFNVVVTLVILVAVDTMFVNKAFELIHLLPSKILRFMGLTPEEGGEKEMVGKAKEGFDTGSKHAQEGMKGAGDKATALAKTDKEKRAKAELPEASKGKPGSQ